MAEYKCFKCGKAVSSKKLDKRFNCASCGSKIFYKPRKLAVKIKTD